MALFESSNGPIRVLSKSWGWLSARENLAPTTTAAVAASPVFKKSLRDRVSVISVPLLVFGLILNCFLIDLQSSVPVSTIVTSFPTNTREAKKVTRGLKDLQFGDEQKKE